MAIGWRRARQSGGQAVSEHKLETIRNIVGIAAIVFALVAIFAGIMAAITGCG